MHRVDDLADIANPGTRGGVHFHHIDMAALGDAAARLADAARLGGRLAGAIRADAVQPLGNDPRRGGFAGPADAGHDERLRDPVGGKGVFQGADHRFLTDQIGKSLGPVFAGKDAVGGINGVRHSASRDSELGQSRAAGGWRPPAGQGC